MAINPLDILKLKDRLNAFRARHPGFSRFISAARKKGVPEGSVLDVTITTPDGQSMATNFRVSAEDIELLRALTSLRQ